MRSAAFSPRFLSGATPANGNCRIRFRHEWIDYPVRALAALFFAFSAGVYFRNALHKIDWAHLHAPQLADAFSVVAIGLYTLMLACLYVLRFKPVNKFAGIVPAAAAIGGCFLLSALLFLAPRTDLPLGVKLLAAALIIVGYLFTVYALSWLGRSFSILPESRKLVTSGPYRVIRHPVYLGEAVATLGAMISFLSPWAVLIVGVQFALQIARMNYEERVLRENFPSYAKYARRTARLIPGIY